MTETQRAALLAAATFIAGDGAELEMDEAKRIAEVLREMASQETAQMTDLRAAAQQALEAMEYSGMDVGKFNRINAAITALRTALAEPAEPVAWMSRDGYLTHYRQGDATIPLYLAPTPRRPLTDEEIYAAITGVDSLKAVEVARAVEAAHGITGEQT